MFDMYELMSRHVSNSSESAVLSREEVVGYVTWLCDNADYVNGLTLAGKPIICGIPETGEANDHPDQS